MSRWSAINIDNTVRGVEQLIGWRVDSGESMQKLGGGNEADEGRVGCLVRGTVQSPAWGEEGSRREGGGST